MERLNSFTGGSDEDGELGAIGIGCLYIFELGIARFVVFHVFLHVYYVSFLYGASQSIARGNKNSRRNNLGSRLEGESGPVSELKGRGFEDSIGARKAKWVADQLH